MSCTMLLLLDVSQATFSPGFLVERGLQAAVSDEPYRSYASGHRQTRRRKLRNLIKEHPHERQ